MHVNLEYYRIFYYVGKLGGITAASKRLNLSQPAVSQAVKQLEAAVGTALFVRTAKGVALTAEGKLLYEYVSKGYESIKLGENKLHEFLNLENGELRIGASDMTLQFFLLPYLQKFHMKYPKIKVTVTNAPTPETLQYMQDGRIDFGIISGPLNELEGLDAIPVKRIQDIFVANRQFSRLANRKLDYQQLISLPIICLEKPTSSRRFMDDYLKAWGVELQPEFELATSDMIVQFVLRNLGIGCVLEDFAMPYIKSGQLFPLEFKEPIPMRDFYLVVNKRYPASKAAGKLLELIPGIS